MITRRDAARGAAVTGLSYSRILGANDRIGLGVIGMGPRNMASTLTLLKGEAGLRYRIEAICTRRPIVHRLASVVDELLMNALHDAPVVCSQPSPQRAMLRWASDDHTLAVSVGDEVTYLVS